MGWCKIKPRYERRKTLHGVPMRIVAHILAVFILLSSTGAFAACSNPTGVAGDMFYNDDHSVMQYCDGTDWTAMKGGGGSDYCEISPATNFQWSAGNSAGTNCTANFNGLSLAHGATAQIGTINDRCGVYAGGHYIRCINGSVVELDSPSPVCSWAIDGC